MKKNAVAIITARGGSKRIPGKNIKPFLGKPIIAYSIEAALSSGLFSEVMVSTDNDAIAGAAKKCGAVVPFVRSKKNADDFASTADVMLEVLEQYKTKGKHFEYSCCLYPTAPFISATSLKSAFELLVQKNLDSVLPVVAFSYPIQRALRMQNDRIQMFQPENLKKRSQDLEKAYHDSGQFYFLKVESFLKQKEMFMAKSGGIVISELEAQDIDNETDWKLAELKFQLLNAKA